MNRIIDTVMVAFRWGFAVAIVVFMAVYLGHGCFSHG